MTDDTVARGKAIANSGKYAPKPSAAPPPRRETEPAPPEDGANLLGDLHTAFGRYVIFPSPEAHDATVLWCAATHGQPAWEHAPRLTPISPVKRCGKSRLMDIAEAVCHEVLITVNASAAAVARSITPDDPPTLMVDEADTIFSTKRAAENNEDVRGILNAGHQRNRPYIRWDVMTRSREKCPTFAMAMLAAIGELPDTIMDRAIVIRMRRRAPGERVTPFRTRRDAPNLHALRSRLHAWIQPHIDTLAYAEPALPVEDRAADTWEPLFIIAELAGGDWPDRARRACLALTEDEPDESGEGAQLLTDLYAIWANDEDYLYTSTILSRLHKVDESPWSECGRKSEPLTPRGLATILKPYGVRSRTVRIGGETSKGYARADLTDPWSRYVVSGTQSDTSVTASHDDENPGPISEYDCDGCVPDSDSRTVTWSEQRRQADCDAVTDVSDYVRANASDALALLTDSPPSNGADPVICRFCGDPIPENRPLARANGYCNKGQCIATAFYGRGPANDD